MKNILNYDLFKLKNEIINIVKKATSSIVKDFKIEEKENNISNIVTSSDISVQNYLVEHLKKLIDNAGFFCEEKDEIENLDNDFIWVIDPIDGTENYSRAIDEYAIVVALTYKKECVIGVVYNVLKNDLYWAIKGEGAYLNDSPIKASNRDFNHSLFCVALCQYYREYSDICNKIMVDAFKEIKDFRRFGSAAIELCYLAEGKVDLFFEMKLSLWDFMAASLILTEAGGFISDLNKAISFKAKSLVMASNNKENLEKLSKIINKHIQKLDY